MNTNIVQLPLTELNEEEDNINIKVSIKKRSRLLYEENEENDTKIDEDKINKMVNLFDKQKYNFTTFENKDPNSISYIVDRVLSQSQCIKLGLTLEKFLTDIILNENKNLENIKPKNKQGYKEKDHLFKDEYNKTIYYAELKSNLNLDTEKSKETYIKCIKIYNDLKNEYKDYSVKMFLVGVRYYKKGIIPKNISKRYETIKDNLIGVNEYFKELNLNISFNNENEYRYFVNKIVDKCYN